MLGFITYWFQPFQNSHLTQTGVKCYANVESLQTAIWRISISYLSVISPFQTWALWPFVMVQPFEKVPSPALLPLFPNVTYRGRLTPLIDSQKGERGSRETKKMRDSAFFWGTLAFSVISHATQCVSGAIWSPWVYSWGSHHHYPFTMAPRGTYLRPLAEAFMSFIREAFLKRAKTMSTQKGEQRGTGGEGSSQI